MFTPNETHEDELQTDPSITFQHYSGRIFWYDETLTSDFNKGFISLARQVHPVSKREPEDHQYAMTLLQKEIKYRKYPWSWDERKFVYVPY